MFNFSPGSDYGVELGNIGFASKLAEPLLVEVQEEPDSLTRLVFVEVLALQNSPERVVVLEISNSCRDFMPPCLYRRLRGRVSGDLVDLRALGVTRVAPNCVQAEDCGLDNLQNTLN